ncbi:hypothetical protein CF319_g9452 [Tilletia indica]|nr:hypothetical protein CF319_g9452 [Tilletia indica]
MLERGDCFSPSTSTSSVAGPEHLVVPALFQPSLLADLPNHDTISTLLAKHIPPHIRPARDTSGTFPPDESPHNPDLALAMRTNAWRRIAVYARDRIISAGAPTSASPETYADIEPAGPNDVSTVLMVDCPLTGSPPPSILFSVPARARVAVAMGHLEREDAPSELCASSFSSNAHGRQTAAIYSFYSPIALGFCSSHSFAYIRATDDPMHASILEPVRALSNPRSEVNLPALVLVKAGSFFSSDLV